MSRLAGGIHIFTIKSSMLFLLLPALACFSHSPLTLAQEEISPQGDNWDQRLEKLRAIPYIGVSESPVTEQKQGVIFSDPESACKGYYLYCNRLTGDVFLLDVAGDVAHQWIFSPDRKEDSEPEIQLDDYAVMLDNGDLLVQKKFMELLLISWASRLIWKKELFAHHDMTAAPDGSFYVLSRDFKIYRGLSVRFPVIVHLSEFGEELDRWSACDHLDELRTVLNPRWFLDTLLDSAAAGHQLDGALRGRISSAKAGRVHFDYFHANTINVLPVTSLGRRDARFASGNLLVCFRNVNQIAILEKDTYRVLWAWGEGELEWPHYPIMLDDGHILIFDNGVERKYSRVVELDPVREMIVWQYVADPPENFFSNTRGSAQRLPNGNTLICESNKGRVFQVTPEGEIVWEWINPRIDQVYRGRPHRETVYRMLYYPPEKVEPLLQRWWWVE